MVESAKNTLPRAENVGILAIEIYFPSTFVNQDELEVFDGVSKGKYTIGLGQLNMACINDREDVNSISLTCVQNLLDKNQLKPARIGRLEVGTETLIDKSKSVKTTLMQLFAPSRAHDIEGVTSINACYGSTNALFNTINWMQSNAWDGRLGIVVSSDVAVYAKGSARPTGGIGSIAMLIGPNAPLVFDDVRASFIDNAYDFYKPILSNFYFPLHISALDSEYPIVDGHLSINIYLNALQQCYSSLKAKCRKRYSGWEPKYQDFDYFCFHTPFSKMVQKCFFNLLLQDIAEYKDKQFTQELVEQIRENDFKMTDKTLKLLMQAFGDDWKNKCERSLLLAKNLGNIYTGSLYNGLLSLIGDTSIDLKGKKIMMFSYGSGCAASMFMVHVKGDYKNMQKASEFKTRLQNRIKVSPEDFDQLMAYREKNFGRHNYEPQGSTEQLFDGTFYLTKVDEKYRRFYAVKQGPIKKPQVLQPTTQNPVLESSKTVRMLKTLENHITSAQQKQQQLVDSSVLKTVTLNFHKKPIQE